MESSDHPRIVRMVPRERPQPWLRAEVLDRLTESDVQRVYREIGVKQFKSGGPENWSALVPWRENKRTEAMTIRKADGLWQDHAQNEGGSLFDAVIKGGLAVDFTAAIEYVVDCCGYLRHQPNGAGRATGAVKVHQTINYDYLDEVGTSLYRAERIETISPDGVIHKRFTVRHWRGDELVYGLPPGVRRVPYNLPEIVARRNEKVWVVEGEKCAEALHAAYGLVATTFFGANWQDSYAGDLDGRDIVVLADRDEPGWKKGQEWATALSRRARSVKLIDLVDLGPRTETDGLDIADWIERGWSYERLAEIVAETPIWVIPKREGLIEWAGSFLTRPFTAPVYLVNNLWSPNSFGVIAAAMKSYKSFFVVDLLCSIASGTPFLGRHEFAVPEPRRVVYWMEEGSTWDFQRRVLRWCDARGIEAEALFASLGLIAGKRLRVNDPEGMTLLAGEIEDSRPDLIVCDTLAAAAVGLDENKTPEMQIIVDNFKRFKDEFGVAVAYVHHTNRSGREGFGSWRGSTVLGAAADCWVTLERKNLLTKEITIDPGMKDHPPRGKFQAELRDGPIPTVDGEPINVGALFYVGYQSQADAEAEAMNHNHRDVVDWIDQNTLTGWASVEEVTARFGYSRNGKLWAAFREAGVQQGWWNYVAEPLDGSPNPGRRAMGLLITRSAKDG